jgi:hypothetical protein
MNDEIHQGVYEAVRQAAREGRTTYYGVIAPLAGLDMGREWDRAEIGRILGAISTHEHEAGRPLLSAIVVHQVDGRPGQGFFALARQLGLFEPGRGEDAFWQAEVRHVHEYWRDH